MSAQTDEIIRGLARIGLEADTAQARLMERHIELVMAANEHFNLTRISAADAVPLHVLDSCAAASALAQAPAGAFADIGSGAGFPGVPLAILTARPLHLVESVRKKAAFLSSAVAELRLDATVHPIRAEELALEGPALFSAVTARAVTALPSLVELGAPLLRPGGMLICLKGEPSEEELRRGLTVARMCGMRERDRIDVRLPDLDVRRMIVTYERYGGMSVSLPRRPGMAQRQPLA